MHAFGPFRYDQDRLLLLRNGDPVPLGRRGALLLKALLVMPGAIVSKDELLAAAWPGAVVEESNLSVQVARLRRLLGPQFIRTVERVGYQFVGTIPPQPAETPARAPMPPGIAVLPFADFGHRRGHGLGDGLAEDVITALSRFHSLRLSARTSSFQYDGRASDIRKVAAALEVEYVLEGSVRLAGDCVKLTVQLIDGATGSHIWAESLDAPACESSDDLAGRAAAMIETQVHLAEMGRSLRERPNSREAYDLYLRGRSKILSSRHDDNATALSLFYRAIGLAPEVPEFLAGAAEALHHRYSVGWSALAANDQQICLDVVGRGVERPDVDAVSLGLFGNALYTAGEEERGEAAAERAVSMNPNSPLVLVCAGLTSLWSGHLERSEALYRRAATINPLDPNRRFALAGVAKVRFVAGDLDEALTWARRANAVNPALSVAHWVLIAGNALLGRLAEAQRRLSRYASISPGVTIARIDAGQPFADRRLLAPMLKGLRLAGMPER